MENLATYKLYALIILAPFFPAPAPGQAVPVQVKLERFQMQSAYLIHEKGDLLSSTSYSSANYWYPVKVPSTVLTGLVSNKVYPDPYTGMNNMLIPDASDSFNHQYNLAQYSHIPNVPNPWKKPYWYRTIFSVPAKDRGQHFQLIFKGINYRAEVWLNGSLIADSSRMAGMFEQFDLDVSSSILAGKENALAVKIFPLDEPGLPAHPQLKAVGDFYDNGGPTGDIGKNVTMLSSVGWDWIPEVRDRNMGIWQPVYLRTSGAVVISRPQVITELPSLPDTGIAKLSLNLQLSNYYTTARKGRLKVTISPENFTGTPVSFSVDATIEAGGSRQLHFDAASTAQLTFRAPKLWWPNGYGRASLYQVRVQWLDGGKLLDEQVIVFGIRTVSSSATMVNGWVRRDFFVNGKRIHLDGGAWVPDMMLNRDRQRYDDELRLCRNANVNLVRIWGGGLGETDDFYELADRYGLLVWQDFWITGDTNGEFKGSADWPLESDVFIKNVVSTIYRIRNHPSLLVWTGGNEGHAREQLYNAIRDNLASLDGTRPFIPSSSGFSKLPAGWKQSWPDNQPAGVYSGGPYSWQDDAVYLALVNAGKDWVFKDETGLPSQPPYSSLPKIIPNLEPDTSLPYPLNNTWGYHDACTGNGHYETYYRAMVDRFGKPASIKEFSDKMQLLNAGGYRSIFEAAAHKLNETGGVMLWKLNAAFPSVVWQIFDWYLVPNAGYYFMKRACEPVHIQLNLDDSSVALVNRSYIPQRQLRYTAEIVNMQGRRVFKQTGATGIGASEVTRLLDLKPVIALQQEICFVILSVTGANGKPVSHNVYWMAPSHNFTSLGQMPKSSVRISLVHESRANGMVTYSTRFTNTSDQLAFFLNPQLLSASEEVLPSFWSDNYFSIPAGETITVTVSCRSALLQKGKSSLRLEGWNVDAQEIGLDGKKE
jgi:hypothetical protein